MDIMNINTLMKFSADKLKTLHVDDIKELKNGQWLWLRFELSGGANTYKQFVLVSKKQTKKDGSEASTGNNLDSPLCLPLGGHTSKPRNVKAMR